MSKPWYESKTLWSIVALVVLAIHEPLLQAIETGDWGSFAKTATVACVGLLAIWARGQAAGPLTITKGHK